MIELVAVPVEGRDRRDVVLLALGFRRRGECLRDRLRARLQRRRAGRKPQRVPMAHRDAPIAHRAAGLRFGDRGERLQRLGIPERVQGPHGVLERLLRGRPAGDREIDFTRRFRRPGPGIGACPGLDRQREKRGGDEDHANSMACHGDILPLMLTPIRRRTRRTGIAGPELNQNAHRRSRAIGSNAVLARWLDPRPAMLDDAPH